MTERLLQFIWQFQYFNKGELATLQGESLLVIFPGHYSRRGGRYEFGSIERCNFIHVYATLECASENMLAAFEEFSDARFHYKSLWL